MNPPPVLSNLRDARADGDQLNLLAVFHFVFAALGLFGVAFLCLHYFIMNTVFGNPDFFKSLPNHGQAPPPEFFEFFNMFEWFYLFFGIMLALGIFLNLFSGFCLMRRKGRMFSMVVAGLNCLHIPFGTALGVFTLIVLMRSSVRDLYQNNSIAPR